jgi:hypothetical protein
VNRPVKRLISSLTIGALLAVAIGAAGFFVVRVHTVTVENWTNSDLKNVEVKASGKVLWRGDVGPRGRKWVFGTQPDGVISDRERKLTVSFEINGHNAGYDFGYITMAESHYLGVQSHNEVRPDTFCRCFF